MAWVRTTGNACYRNEVGKSTTGLDGSLVFFKSMTGAGYSMNDLISFANQCKLVYKRMLNLGFKGNLDKFKSSPLHIIKIQ